MFLGIAGAALLYGDGMITPAISVLSAASKGFADRYARFHAVYRAGDDRDVDRAIPLSTARNGRHRRDLWTGDDFVVCRDRPAGNRGDRASPRGLVGGKPSAYAIRFFITNQGHGFSRARLRPYFWSAPAAEALYAETHGAIRSTIDPHRLVHALVLPAALDQLLRSEGAILLTQPVAASHPFYMLAPSQGTLSARGACHLRHNNRFASNNLGSIFFNATGRPPGRFAPLACRADFPR